MRNKVVTWADGFGVWHARVVLAIATPSDTLSYDSVRGTARRAIRREIVARNNPKYLQGYVAKIVLDKCDLGADNRIYSITFREKV